jgi:2-polyprenyl-6-methoxyphenol hydroxylase-like FAD-dependent oxidoreductase
VVSERKDKVRIQTGDNYIYEGDILVGADGAYSAVRQRLYEALKKEGKLPKSDQKDLPFRCTSLVGQTRPLDVAEFPIIQESLCQSYSTLGDNKPFSVSLCATILGYGNKIDVIRSNRPCMSFFVSSTKKYTMYTTAQRSICYTVQHQLDAKSSKAAEEQRFRNNENSEWGPGAAQAMCDETRDFPLPIPGGKIWTLGDLYDRTPQERISKVMLEEKVFKTWYSGRTVLMGDGKQLILHW